MRYGISVAMHYLTGKITAHHAIHALRFKPVAVASKGRVWIVEPGFQI